ncbi:MAG: hypothetical protein K2J31_03425 [Alistipes sp.]|nr:hypothetical protein [Alistipes sp.]MDE6861783.1 hypothetical protein [Alistipes sp.]MDE7129985.1 hypothetical protein [Alistipes sp.]
MKIMKLFAAFACTALLLASTACDPHRDNQPETIPDSIAYTEWYSQGLDEDGNTVYYTLKIETQMATLTASDAQENGHIVSQKPLEVAYTKPNVRLTFYDGGRFAGYIIDKQYTTINGVHVYIMQLFGVDESGNVILGDDGKPASTMIFWKE